MLFEACSGSDGLLGRAELSEVLWQDLQVLREGEVLWGAQKKKGTKNGGMKNIFFLVVLGGFPYMSRIHT